MKIVTAICVLVVVTAALPAAHADQAWSYASSDFFEAYTTGTEKDARAAIAGIERYHAFFERLLEVSPGSWGRPQLVVFSTPKEFAPYRTSAHANAFWLGTPARDFIVLHSLDDVALPVVVHEYTHLMMGRAGIDYPLWLNEGLAGFYSTARPEGSKMRLGLALPHATETLARAGTLIPLDRLFAIDDRSPETHDPRGAPLFYAESWALTHMLLTHERYRDGVSAVLTAVALGTPSADALRAAYHKPLDAMGADLRTYLARFKFTSTVAVAPVGPRDTHVTSRPADDHDVKATLAAILARPPANLFPNPVPSARNIPPEPASRVRPAHTPYAYAFRRPKSPAIVDRQWRTR